MGPVLRVTEAERLEPHRSLVTELGYKPALWQLNDVKRSLPRQDRSLSMRVRAPPPRNHRSSSAVRARDC